MEFAARLVVADSFRVRGAGDAAAVRGCERHFERFSSGVTAVAGTLPAEFDDFIARARGEIAAFGEGFPRLELWELGTDDSQVAHELRLSLRPLPKLHHTIALHTVTGFELERPRVKGANLTRLGQLNAELGAEALLVDAAGNAVEGATTSVVWWDGDVLCTVASQERVSSVAEALTRELALTSGLASAIEPRDITPTELAAHEVWAVNALHGIRPVTHLDGVPLPTGTPGRRARAAELLDATWRPLLPAPAPAV